MSTTLTTSNSTTLTIKNTIVNACVQVAPPVFLEPVDKVRLLVQVYSTSSLTGPIINEDKVYNVSELDQATLWFFIPSPSSGTVYYARASWSEYIEYTDIAGTAVVESPINWSEVEIIEFNNGSGSPSTPPPTTPTTPPPGTPTTPPPDTGTPTTPPPDTGTPTTPPPGGVEQPDAEFTGPSSVNINETATYTLTYYDSSVTYTVSVTGGIGGTVSRNGATITFTAGSVAGTAGINIEARLGNTTSTRGGIITIVNP